MSPEIEQFRALRPDVAPPSDRARLDAWRQLMAAIEDEPAGWHAHRHADERSRRSARRHGSRHGLRLRLGLGLAGTLAVVVAIIVIAGLHRLGPVAPTAPGSISAGGRALAPGVIRTGLAQEYQPQLAAGESLHTFLDPALQRAGRRALLRSMKRHSGIAGAYVAMDPRTGAVRAIGSLSRGHHTRTQEIDLATGLAGPIGSAFAPITVLAALRSGAWAPGERFTDTGEYCAGSHSASDCLHNPGDEAYGVVGIPSALRSEDEVFLARLAVATERRGAAGGGGWLRQTARDLGIGRRTGIDLPGEATGRIPSPPASGGPDALVRDESVAIGLGGLQVSPIQLAVAYSALANGGTVVHPRVGSTLTVGGHARPIPHPRAGHLPIASAQLAALRRGLRAATGSAGVAETVGHLPSPVFAQVGTVPDRAGGRSTADAWFAGYVPGTSGHGPLVVVVYVDEGGFGGVAAAPVARALFSQWLTGRPRLTTAGTSTGG